MGEPSIDVDRIVSAIGNSPVNADHTFTTVTSGMLGSHNVSREDTITALETIAFGTLAGDDEIASIQTNLIFRIIAQADDDVKRLAFFAWAFAVARGNDKTILAAQRILHTDLSGEEIAVALADAAYAKLTIIDPANGANPFRSIAPDYDLANDLGESQLAPQIQYEGNDHISAKDISLEGIPIFVAGSETATALQELISQ